jgi:hypothetical protein
MSFRANFGVTLPAGATVTYVVGTADRTETGGNCSWSTALITPSGTTATVPSSNQLPWFNLTGGQTVTYIATAQPQAGESFCGANITEAATLQINYTLAPTLSFSTPGLNQNTWGSMTITVTDAAGSANLRGPHQVVSNSGLTYAGGCNVQMDGGSSGFYLFDDYGTSAGWVDVGSPATISTSVCSIRGTGSSISWFGWQPAAVEGSTTLSRLSC